MDKNLKLTNTHHLRTTSWHPQTDGMVEKMAKTISMYINSTHKDWNSYLNFALFSIENFNFES